ncbi:MAG: conjugal transfer protein, partial [Pseudonocardiales bacterium]
MTAPYQRRRDPQPMGQGWEVAVAVIGGALLGFGLAALAGLGVASALFGDGWVWPHGT